MIGADMLLLMRLVSFYELRQRSSIYIYFVTTGLRVGWSVLIFLHMHSSLERSE